MIASIDKVKAIVVLIAYAFILSKLVINFYRNERAKGFRTTKGVVKFSEKIKVGNANSIKVEYTYAVEDVQYSSDRIKMGSAFHWSAKAMYKYLDKYKVGDAVEVRYDPFDPRISCLEIGGSAINLVFIIGSLLAIWFGVYMLGR